MVARADIEIFYSESAPAFAYIEGAAISAGASAPSASQGSNSIEVPIVGAAISCDAGDPVLFAEPPRYSQFVSQAIFDLELTTNFMTTGPATIVGTDEYSDNGSHTVFYEQYAGVMQGIDWAARTGNTVNINETGRLNALQITRGRWNRPVNNWAQAIYRDADNWHEAFNRGEMYLDDLDTVGSGNLITASTAEITQTIFPNFTRGTMSQNGLGVAGNVPPLGRACITEYSRPTAKLVKGCVYHRADAGTDYETNDGAATVEFRAPLFNALVGNCHRFFYEQYNTFDTGSRADTGASFMLGLTLDAFFANRDELISRGEDPDLYFPGQGARAFSGFVLDGEEFEGESYEVMSNITCPWNTTYYGEYGLEMVREFIEWAWGYAILEMTGWGPDVLPSEAQWDQRPPPTTRAEFNAGAFPLSPKVPYFRVMAEHLARNEVPGGFPSDDPRPLGHPMVRMNSAGVFNVLGRTYSPAPYQNAGRASNNANLQQICVYPVYAFAAALRQNGADEADIQRYVTLGDFLWDGAIEYSDRDTQRARNQDQSTKFRAIAKRNIAAGGRND